MARTAEVSRVDALRAQRERDYEEQQKAAALARKAGEAMTTNEREERDRLVAVVDRGARTFLEVGQAVAIIQGRRLYRETHATFDDFIRERWGWTGSRARQLLGTVEVMEQLESVTPGNGPTNEKQARELVAVPEEKRAEVWETALADAKTPGKPTGAEVRTAATPHKPKRDSGRKSAPKGEPCPTCGGTGRA